MKKALLEAEAVSPASSTTPSGSSTCVSEPASPADGAQTSSSETVWVKPRQRGRRRPRPISDYGQLISRSHSIPEKATEQHAKYRTADDLLEKDCPDGFCGNHENPDGSSINGDVQSRRLRPLSVIGGVDGYPPSAEDKDERLSSVSYNSHSVSFPQL